jgi:surface protein
MKHIFTISLCFLALSLSAQETITYPYNPDGDVDGAIASPDLLDILGVYGGEFSPSEIQIDGVGLLQVIQDLQNQLASIQLIDVNYVEATLIAHQQELAAHQQEIDNLNQQIAENALPDGTVNGQLLRWNGTAWIPTLPYTSFFFTDDNIHEAAYAWIDNEESAEATYGHISEWDVSQVTNMAMLFDFDDSFNEDLSSWDVSNVTTMRSMFEGATNFNSDLSSWDVSSVTDMYAMFRYASGFNQDISSWDVSSVTDMGSLFPHPWGSDMFAFASALSEANKCLIHTSFSSNTAWPYEWSGFCE